MAVKETRCYRIVWRYLIEHPYLAMGYRSLAKLLDIAVNTLKAAIAYYRAQDQLETEPGCATKPSVHRLKNDSATESKLTQGGESKMAQAGEFDPPDEQKLTHPACPTCEALKPFLLHLLSGHALPGNAVFHDSAHITRARQTTDLPENTDGNKQVSEVGRSVVFLWLEKHFGKLGADLKRRFQFAIHNCGIAEELVVRFFEEKWPQVVERFQRGRLSYLDPGLLLADLREGQVRAWVNLNAELLARESRWLQTIAESENARKGMASETPMTDEEIQALYRQVRGHA